MSKTNEAGLEARYRIQVVREALASSDRDVRLANMDAVALLNEATKQVAALEAELAKLQGQEPVAFYWQDVGYKNPNRHGPYFGWPTEAALRNVDGGAIPVPLYATPQPSAVPEEKA